MDITLLRYHVGPCLISESHTLAYGHRHTMMQFARSHVVPLYEKLPCYHVMCVLRGGTIVRASPYYGTNPVRSFTVSQTTLEHP